MTYQLSLLNSGGPCPLTDRYGKGLLICSLYQAFNIVSFSWILEHSHHHMDNYPSPIKYQHKPPFLTETLPSHWTRTGSLLTRLLNTWLIWGFSPPVCTTPENSDMLVGVIPRT